MEEEHEDPRNKLAAALQLLLADRSDEDRKYVIERAFAGSRWLSNTKRHDLRNNLGSLAAQAAMVQMDFD